MEYAPRPRVTKLDGNERALDGRERAIACWLIHRYSSHAFVEEAHALFGAIVRAFEAWPQRHARTTPDAYRELDEALHTRVRAFVTGLEFLAHRDLVHAAESLLAATGDIEPDDPRNERHFSLQNLAFELGSDTQQTGERAGAMFARIERTLRGTWAYDQLVADETKLAIGDRSVPTSLSAIAMPDDRAITVKTGQLVPQSGIWIPSTIRRGCPNLLLYRTSAPQLNRASVRYDHPAWPEVAGTIDDWRSKSWTEYEYVSEPTVWRFVSSLPDA